MTTVWSPSTRWTHDGEFWRENFNLLHAETDIAPVCNAASIVTPTRYGRQANFTHRPQLLAQTCLLLAVTFQWFTVSEFTSGSLWLRARLEAAGAGRGGRRRRWFTSPAGRAVASAPTGWRNPDPGAASPVNRTSHIKQQPQLQLHSAEIRTNTYTVEALRINAPRRQQASQEKILVFVLNGLCSSEANHVTFFHVQKSCAVVWQKMGVTTPGSASGI